MLPTTTVLNDNNLDKSSTIEDCQNDKPKNNDITRIKSIYYYKNGALFKHMNTINCQLFDLIEIHEGILTENAITNLSIIQNSALYAPFQTEEWQNTCDKFVTKSENHSTINVLCYILNTPVIHFSLVKHNYMSVKILKWRNYKFSDYCVPLIHRDFTDIISCSKSDEILFYVSVFIGDVDLIYLEKQPERFAEIDNSCVNSLSVPYHHSSYSTRLLNDWIKYYTSKRSSKTRRRLKEKLSALQKNGKLSFRFLDTSDAASILVEKCLVMKSTQLEKRKFHDPFRDNNVRLGLSKYFGSRVNDDTWVAGLFLDNKVLAAAFGFRQKKTWFLYQLSMMDEESSKYSPGVHLTMNILEHAIKSDCEVFDFGLGDEAYKLDWCESASRLMTTIIPVTRTGKFAKFVMVFDAKLKSNMNYGTRLHRIAKRTQRIMRRFNLLTNR